MGPQSARLVDVYRRGNRVLYANCQHILLCWYYAISISVTFEIVNMWVQRFILQNFAAGNLA